MIHYLVGALLVAALEGQTVDGGVPAAAPIQSSGSGLGTFALGSEGYSSERIVSANNGQTAPAPPVTAEQRQARATREFKLYCSPETADTDARFVRGKNVLGTDQLFVQVPAGTLGQTARLRGVTLHYRAAPTITREWLTQTLLCHRAQGTLGLSPSTPEPNDPFWADDDWVEIKVESEEAGFSVELRSEDPQSAGKLLARATAFAQAHAVEEGPPTPTPQEPAKGQPFAWADWGWMNGTSRQVDFPMDGPVFTGNFNVDVGYNWEFSQPMDHTIDGSTASFRHNELQLTHLGIGADFHWHNVRGRLMTQLGMYSTTTPRNDASPSRGQWQLADAFRYIAEAYGGYHFDVMYGINVDAGIFLSYVGLCSYYNYENWTDQASYVSSNTPWFFNGIRIQTFPTDRLKIELWIINGWQSYGVFNEQPGLGLQVQYRPTASLAFVGSTYFGADTLGNPGRLRFHTDDSVLVKYFENKSSPVSRGALSLTVDLGCEHGGGVRCWGGNATTPSQYFIGAMLYNRLWFARDLFGLTIGGGFMVNPGRYLVLTPPINGATAASGSAYFSQSPGDSWTAWDTTETFDFMPLQFLTLRAEYTHRWASVPYFAGPGGMTPPGGSQSLPGSAVPGWKPDLRQSENRLTFAIMVRI